MLDAALPKLCEAAGGEVTGSLGDAEPLMAIQDAVNLGRYDEIIISTLPLGVSRWLKLDLVSKARRSGCRSPTSRRKRAERGAAQVLTRDRLRRREARHVSCARTR